MKNLKSLPVHRDLWFHDWWLRIFKASSVPFGKGKKFFKEFLHLWVSILKLTRLYDTYSRYCSGVTSIVDNMIPLWTELIEGSKPETFVILEVTRTRGDRIVPLFVYLCRDHQDSILRKLTQLDLNISPQAIFDELKAYSNHMHRGIDLQPQDLHVRTLADYIGFLRGFWPNPYEQPVKFLINEYWGVRILVPQQDSEVIVNANEQRFIYHASKRGERARKISGDLVYMHKKEKSHQTRLEKGTVRRLRYIINGRCREHPSNEDNHWMKVVTPYPVEPDEGLTVCDESVLPQLPVLGLALSRATPPPGLSISLDRPLNPLLDDKQAVVVNDQVQHRRQGRGQSRS